jgi:Raf kinase inhibitor-like YbhB/YbcL family protein
MNVLRLLIWIGAALALLAACGRTTPGQPAQAGGDTVNFAFSSTAFADGQAIPANYTCDGANASPPLRWDGPPQAQSFALIVDDPDAPGGIFTHWVLYDILGAQRELPEGAPGTGTPGMNDFSKAGYGGPCPPRGNGPHRYIFTLYALDIPSLKLPAGRPRQEIERAMQGHVLAQAKLMGRYERR